MWDGRRVIAGCFTRMLRRCAGRINVRFLHILQEIRVIGKTRNQLFHMFSSGIVVGHRSLLQCPTDQEAVAHS
jgi:hypothetical protein